MSTFHQRHSIRLKDFDYSQLWGYFITINSYEQLPLFGELKSADEVHLSGIGEIVQREWERMPDRFPNTYLDTFIIMPNHLHGIIFIDNLVMGRSINQSEKFSCPTTGSIPTIIRSFKGKVTTIVHAMKGHSHQTVWHRNYYEQVIRNEKHLEMVRKYIIENPLSARKG
jgi:putative transposase